MRKCSCVLKGSAGMGASWQSWQGVSCSASPATLLWLGLTKVQACTHATRRHRPASALESAAAAWTVSVRARPWRCKAAATAAQASWPAL